ncbi:DNA topoisomerase III [Lachnospiraceae bacterium KM106-2]|nr:DNA topoisomerase III [Lachnospiraceae bacterium KM106-2]
MSKYLYISEKPSVAQEFAKALKLNGKKRDGYLEADDAIVTWCVGHLVTMSYPEAYDPAMKKWSLQTVPFLPEQFLYEVIPNVSKQFETVKMLLNREDVTRIYVCTDSGREGEYIYRLVDQMANVSDQKEKRRVWIDSQTEEEILRGIREAKPLSEYDNLAASAYLRAKEDYLMGINFSRVLSLKYGQTVMNYRKSDKWSAISVGRVMTCVLGMVVKREREIRAFVKTPFYRILSNSTVNGTDIESEWRAVAGSKFFESPALYKENGFKEESVALGLVEQLKATDPLIATVEKVEKKKEKKNPPLLYNLAEIQNECSKLFKISPDETLKIIQELYEKKLVTYPRTDARVLSTAVAKEIHKNIRGLCNYTHGRAFAAEILEKKSYEGIAKTRYVNDKQITDHYAIIPTGQGLNALNSLAPTSAKVYETIVRRFLSIFYPPAVYEKLNIVSKIGAESFFANYKVLADPGYLKLMTYSFGKKKEESDNNEGDSPDGNMVEALLHLKKGMTLEVKDIFLKEGETSPPKRYNSGSLILAMENAGQLIEDEELRAQIKGSGIGTSATRAEILNKLFRIEYINLNKKTQIVTPTQLGEMIFDVVNTSIRSLLNPELTASWEKGLNYVAEGQITEEEYLQKLEGFVTRQTNGVKNMNNQFQLRYCFDQSAEFYKSGKK